MGYIAKVFALTSTIKQVYATLFVPVIEVALTPVGESITCTGVQLTPNRDLCTNIIVGVVSVYPRSPVTSCGAHRTWVAFLSPGALIQVVPSYNFNWINMGVLSYQSCPSTGLPGAVLFVKFSKDVKVFCNSSSVCWSISAFFFERGCLLGG